MASVQEIGQALVDYCRSNDTATALERLYADDAVSVEAFVPEGQERVTEGREGIAGKHAWWAANFEVHRAEVEGPFPSGDDRFAVIFEIDATHKESGQREAMKEVALYHVADGKIVREEFFYSVG
ncbi:MAG: nuclear transport factor 2 family protein [Roseitalea porphyridii]|jgi:ketosteroid isomerase-like protein|uniref:nuclear transport factor 2 family protein n=1 Tax=Roseitalea porphyridii TaxID=1852022 RepID=UPI0032EBA914